MENYFKETKKILRVLSFIEKFLDNVRFSFEERLVGLYFFAFSERRFCTRIAYIFLEVCAKTRYFCYQPTEKRGNHERRQNKSVTVPSVSFSFSSYPLFAGCVLLIVSP